MPLSLSLHASLSLSIDRSFSLPPSPHFSFSCSSSPTSLSPSHSFTNNDIVSSLPSHHLFPLVLFQGLEADLEESCWQPTLQAVQCSFKDGELFLSKKSWAKCLLSCTSCMRRNLLKGKSLVLKCRKTFARYKFRTARAVSHTLVYLHDVRGLLNFAFFFQPKVRNKQNQVACENFCNRHL